MKIYLSTFVIFFELPYSGVDKDVRGCVRVCPCARVRVFIVTADSFLCTCHNLFTCSFFNFFVFELQKKKDAPQNIVASQTQTHACACTHGLLGLSFGESVPNVLITCFYHLNHFIDEIRRYNGFPFLQLQESSSAIIISNLTIVYLYVCVWALPAITTWWLSDGYLYVHITLSSEYDNIYKNIGTVATNLQSWKLLIKAQSIIEYPLHYKETQFSIVQNSKSIESFSEQFETFHQFIYIVATCPKSFLNFPDYCLNI